MRACTGSHIEFPHIAREENIMQTTTNPLSGITKAPDTEKTDSKESVKAQEKPPQMKSQQRSKIIVREDGRRFKNGVELFYEKIRGWERPCRAQAIKNPQVQNIPDTANTPTQQ